MRFMLISFILSLVVALAIIGIAIVTAGGQPVSWYW